MPRLPREQLKRLEKLSTDRFFLLGAHVDGADALHFDVSGSTGNVYHVTLNRRSRRFDCNCPDASSHARRHQVECKHVLFVLCRVLRSTLTAEHFANARKVPADRFVDWTLRVRSLHAALRAGAVDAQHSDLVNEVYRQRYEAAKSAGVGGAAARGTDASSAAAAAATSSAARAPRRLRAGVVLSSAFVGRGADEECPICFDELIAHGGVHSATTGGGDAAVCDAHDAQAADACVSRTEDRELVQCSTCTRAVHRDCADQWISNGHHTTCVYCRSPLAYAQAPSPSATARRQRRRVAAEGGGAGATVRVVETDAGVSTYVNVAAVDNDEE